jgi:hypothetical protein
MKWNYAILITFLHAGVCNAQQPSENEQDLSRMAEELIGFQDLDADYEQLYENLMQVLATPVDLNKVSEEELRLLHILDERQISAFSNYRREQGPLFSIYELQAIPEFDPITLRKFKPFVRVSDAQSQVNKVLLHRMFFEKNNYLLTRYERTLEHKEGFNNTDTNKKFKGSEDKLYLRYRSVTANDFSIGFTAEKDAGEKLSWNTQTLRYGFDFLSYHFQIKNKGRLKNFIAGDFQCQFGQGVVLGGAFGLGKGSETITTVRRSNAGLLPYTSSIESGYFRGVAATYQLGKHFFLTTLYSSATRDASLQSDSLTETISSFQSTGFHRNEAELNYRKKVWERNYGTVLNYKLSNLDAGLIFHQINFENSILKNNSVYNQFAFKGKENNTVGVFLNYTFRNANFFGETAKAISGGQGTIAGVLAALHQNFDVALVYRLYDRDYYSFYANAFSENSIPRNESGFYWGWKYSWKKKITLAGYYDLFHFPWLSFRRYAPAHGSEWLLRLTYQPSRQIILYTQMREEQKPRNSGTEISLYDVAAGVKRNYWFSASYALNHNLTLKTRLQYNTYTLSSQETKGMTMLQDISYRIHKFEITARHAMFDTEDYENRNYVYENDAWMAFSLPAYYGVGVRNYILLEYKISKSLSIWLRYARTKYTDRDSIGSGLDIIDGNIKNDIKFQTLFRF